MSLVKVIHIAEEFQQALAQPGKLVCFLNLFIYLFNDFR